MDKLTGLFNEINSIVSHPADAVKKFKAETGNHVIGCLPVYTPEEVVHAAGCLPIGLWGGQTKLTKTNKYFPAFACSIMQSVMEFALNGVYNELAAAIIPAPCDTLKSVGQDWLTAAPKVKAIHIVHPQMSAIPAGIQYTKSEIIHIKNEIEKITGKKITDESVHASIDIYNKFRKTMREFAQVAAEYPHIITPGIRHMIMKGSYFTEKGRYTSIVKEIIAELRKQNKVNWAGKKVILTGIMAEPSSLLDLFNDYKISVAGDDLAHESRQFRTDAPDAKCPYERLARMWASMDNCSLIYDPAKKRGQMLIDMVKKTGADGIVMCMMKFCDPEEFDYPIIKKEVEAAKIPLLYLEIDQQMQSVEQVRTRIQGFSESLGQ